MFDEEYKNMIVTFLQRNYPIARVKHENRFRRAIVLDGHEPYFLANTSSMLPIKVNLANTLKIIFDCDRAMAEELISKALSI